MRFALTTAHFSQFQSECMYCLFFTCVQVLDSLYANLGPYEIRLNHRTLFSAALRSLQLPEHTSASVMTLLATAAATSPAASEARAGCWPGIRAGLDGLGLDSGPVSRCRQCVLQLPGRLNQGAFGRLGEDWGLKGAGPGDTVGFMSDRGIFWLYLWV